MKIYVLSQEYCYGDYKYKYKEKSRFIGIYLTRKEALKALEKFKKIRGFSSHISNFYISCYTVDKTLEWLNNYSIDNWHAVGFMGKFYKQNIE